MATVRFFRRPLPSGLTPAEALRTLRGDRRPFALVGAWAGGGAIVGSDPVLRAQGDPFSALASVPSVSGSVPRGAVGGGWVGWLGYGLGASVERVPPSPPRPVPLPQASLAYYDHVLRRDAEGQWWFEALWTESEGERLEAMLARATARLSGGAPPAVPFSCGAFTPRPSAAGHAEAVRTCLEYIRAGDLYQANLTLRLEASFDGEPLDAFALAVERVGPRYGAFFGGGDGAVVSFSPELFLARRGRDVRTEPIKGTAPRTGAADEDDAARRGLVASVKDRAENVMILDLMRNDLGRVCAYGSVVADAVARPEAHAGVWHLVSSVSGRLRDDVDDAALLRATFPPGSVTGAPKVKALEVISTLESTGREVYTGAIGFASPVAGLELNVAIRTFEVAGGRIWLGAGGGVVADSQPAAEYAECLVKAEPLVRALGASIAAPDSVGSVALPAAVTRAARPDPACGVFTTLAAGADVEPHLRRLAVSARVLYGIEIDEGEVAAEVVAVAEPARVRVVVMPDGGVSVSFAPLGESFPARAARLEPLVVPGGLGEHKWIDRALVDAAPGEPLIVDIDGSVLESGWGNVWIVERGRLATPPTDGRILPGVTRAQLLALTHAREEEISFARYEAADEIFVTSSIRQVQPVRGGPVTAEAARLLADAQRTANVAQ